MTRLSGAILVATALFSAASLHGADPERDFSGQWRLTGTTGDPGEVESTLTVSQSDFGMNCSAGKSQWMYALDGSEVRKQYGAESRSSVAKWEGAALLINTIVSGPSNYTLMDRWKLSRDRSVLTINRQVVRKSGAVEGEMVYRRADTSAPGAPPMQSAGAVVTRTPVRSPEPGIAPDITVPTGTRVLLQLINEINTKRAKEGDRVYLRTATPIAAGGRIAIPLGSNVAGVITRAKPAGRVQGKGELFIRFDSLTLPNGVTRDFRSRPSGEEGKVEGDGKAADPTTVMAGAGMGASIGAITRGLSGAAVGGGIGALIGVLASRNQNVVLRPGASIEMVLDRDLIFSPNEIPYR
jgi:type IV secretion system protein VirB10